MKKYTVSHHMTDRAGMDADMHKPTAHMQTLFNKVIAYYSPIPTIYYLPKMNTPAVSE